VTLSFPFALLPLPERTTLLPLTPPPISSPATPPSSHRLPRLRHLSESKTIKHIHSCHRPTHSHPLPSLHFFLKSRSSHLRTFPTLTNVPPLLHRSFNLPPLSLNALASLPHIPHRPIVSYSIPVPIDQTTQPILHSTLYVTYSRAMITPYYLSTFVSLSSSFLVLPYIFHLPFTTSLSHTPPHPLIEHLPMLAYACRL
jgi:hypothetical protein